MDNKEEKQLETFVHIEQVIKECVGANGFWQWMVILMVVLTCSATTTFEVFANSIPQVRCKMEHGHDMKLKQSYPNASFAQLRDMSTSDSRGCTRYKISNWSNFIDSLNSPQPDTNPKDYLKLEPCPYGYEYEMNEYQYPGGIVVEWDLVCDRANLVPLATYFYLIGMLLGSVIGGFMGDYLGRKTGGIVVSIIECIFGFATSFSPNYMCYVIMRSVVAGSGVARTTIFILISLEITTCRHRSTFLSMWGLFQNFLSRSILSVLAYCIPNWRWLHSAHNSPSCLFFLYFFFLPESPQWLISKGKNDLAIRVLKHGQRLNERFFGAPKINSQIKEAIFMEFERIIQKEETEMNQPLGIERTGTKALVKQKLKKFTRVFLAPYKTKKLFKTSILSTLVWTLQILTYYGLTYYAVFTRMSVYLVTALNSCMCLIATFYVLIVYRIFESRKRPLMFCYALAASVLLTCGIYNLVLNPESDYVTVVCVNVVILTLQAAMNMLFIYIPELYPAEVRSMGFGNTGGLGRIGGAFCIFLNQLDALKHGIPITIYGVLLLVQILILVFMNDIDYKFKMNVRLKKRRN
ncbi:hypothetical protein Ciccas_006163 [Cichlidogyrus casuarinus]|uniref:Major facilitator superfamily (MFS) profile domain-containing protein n=1 Tax=Cichlidogyrus casuarinus TaxID=1844966 RepID=A0ABD2Q6M4_9PLAT